MTPAQIAADALGIAPGAIHSVERIKGGLTNESWIVRAASGSVVVRLSTADEKALQIDRKNEAQLLGIVAVAGIGAPVLMCAPDRRVLVTQYLSGRTWSAEDARSPRNVQRVARLLRQLHQIAAPSAHVTDLRESVTGYLATLEDRQRTTTLSATDVARAMNISTLAMTDLQPVLCHNDVHHLNLVDNGERLWLIDWEYAGLGNPLFDLAAVCCYHHYDAALRRGLAECYWGSCSVVQLAQLDEMCWLFDYIKELWFLVREPA